MPINRIIFSPRASKRLASITEYIFIQTQSAEFTINYLNNLQNYIKQTLTMFPEAGRLCEEYGTEIRKLVYQKYSILYRIKETTIEILTIFRENEA